MNAPAKKKSTLMRILILLGIGGALCGALLLGFMMIVIQPQLPDLAEMTDYRPKMPLRVYTADGALLGEFGQQKRDFIAAKDMPVMMKKALLAVEDSRFYEHGGVDFKGVLRAIVSDLSGGMRQGASTITMQIARDFYLTREKLMTRKLTEVMLAHRIESALNKEQILELYMNQVYLGERAYGFGAAARIYYGKKVSELSIAQMAMLAGLPQRPADANPVANYKRARNRQLIVLRRMLDTGAITQAQYEAAKAEPHALRERGRSTEPSGEYVAEMVRQALFEQYKEQIYVNGLSVYTTVNKAEQEAAWDALRRQVLTYESRHGFRGPEARIALPANAEEREEAIADGLEKLPRVYKIPLAVVLAASPKLLKVETESGEELEIGSEGLRLVQGALSAKADAQKKITPGAVLRLMQDAKGRWQVVQLPQVAAGFTALDAKTGAVRALVGGFDYNLSKFNHATQAWRQPGSSIKPFIYSAGVEEGMWPGTLINGRELSIPSGGNVWSPENDDGVYEDAVSMKQALTKSKNVIAVRILRHVGITRGHAFLQRFGFDLDKHPKNLTMALGTGSVTVQQMAAAYAVFANGGHRVQPYLIAKVQDARGKVLFEARPTQLDDSTRVLSAQNAFLMHQMMHQVTVSGTAAAATQRLGRQDLAGKTGTTSDALDGWFGGYAQNIVAVGWMGYDDPRSLGGKEFGSSLALPIWIDYMRVALAGKPAAERPLPGGIVFQDGDYLPQARLEDGSLIRAVELGEAAGESAPPAQTHEPEPQHAPAPQPAAHAPAPQRAAPAAPAAPAPAQPTPGGFFPRKPDPAPR
ncbi:PBP1A family penicillin-binding protein [Massilia sp. W12]|uniref:penicillin-binding protein 1A n=1 Tax=Massilia sp. W12 TaxID=3126507 RepID=UPI0030D0B80B